MENSKPGLVLLAEDDENDVFLMRRAFHEAGLELAMIDVPNGEEAIKYLSGRGPYTDRDSYPLPALLLLDLKMPLLNGFELLAWLQRQLDLRTLPAVVLSSSGFDFDIQRALQLGARDYMVKPQTHNGLVKLVRQINSRWLHESIMLA
jgi:CheY-like chemotaxis protein